MIQIKAPDGSIVQFPPDTDDATITRVMSQAYPQPKQAPTRGALSDATDKLSSAFTFGLSNDMAGAARAVGPLLRGEFDKVGEAYRSGRDASIQRANGFSDRNPVTGFALDVAGGLANPVSRVIGPTPGASLARQSAQAAGQGAAMGAAYGFGGTEGDLGDRATGAVQGGLIGGAVGGLAPGVVEGASRGLQYGADQIVNRFTTQGQRSIAGRKVAEALTRDGMSLDDAAARLAAMPQEAALADIGANSQALAGAISRAPGQGRAAITDFVTARQEGARDLNNVLRGGQAERINATLDSVTPARYRQAVDALDAQRKSAAAPLYDEAFGANKAVDSPLLQRIQSTPAGERAFAQARAMMQNDMQRLGVSSPELTQLAREAGVEGGAIPKGGVADGLKLEFWDYVKRALDDQIGAAQRTGANQEARVLTGLKSSLVKELDALDVTAKAGPNSVKPEGGAYARARAAYAGPSQLMDAAESGTQFMRGATYQTPDDVSKALASMSEDQRHAFRMGAVQALRNEVDRLPVRADATKKLMDVPGLERKVRAAFGDDQTFSRYIGALQSERQMFNTYAEITGNSRTAARQLADADLKNDPGGFAEAAVSMAAQPLNPWNYVRAGVNALRGAQSRLSTPEPARDQIARLLMSRDVNALRPQMEAVQMSEARRNALARALLGGNAAAAPGYGQ